MDAVEAFALLNTRQFVIPVMVFVDVPDVIQRCCHIADTFEGFVEIHADFIGADYDNDVFGAEHHTRHSVAASVDRHDLPFQRYGVRADDQDIRE